MLETMSVVKLLSEFLLCSKSLEIVHKQKIWRAEMISAETVGPGSSQRFQLGLVKCEYQKNRGQPWCPLPNFTAIEVPGFTPWVLLPFSNCIRFNLDWQKKMAKVKIFL